MSIETYGTGQRLRCAARLAGEYCKDARLVLLPVPVTRDKKHITDTDILLEDTLTSAEAGSCFVGYGLPEWYTEELSARGALFHDLSKDEKYLCDNACITAVGAVGYILTSEKRSPEDISFGVIGYGRIGKALVRILLFLGARVKVFTSRNLTRLDLGECGINSCLSADISVGEYNFEGIDLLINTAPKDMRDCFNGGKLPLGMRLLELASGDNFNGVCGVEKLPSLPERMFPESAGRTYFEAVKGFLETLKKEGGEK